MKPEFADHLTLQEMLARAVALVSQAHATTQVRASPCHHFTQMSESMMDIRLTKNILCIG